MHPNNSTPQADFAPLQFVVRGAGAVLFAFGAYLAVTHAVFQLGAEHTVGYVVDVSGYTAELPGGGSRARLGSPGGGGTIPVTFRVSTVEFGTGRRYWWDFGGPFVPRTPGSPVGIAYDRAMKQEPQLDGIAGFGNALLLLAGARAMWWLAAIMPRWAKPPE